MPRGARKGEARLLAEDWVRSAMDLAAFNRWTARQLRAELRGRYARMQHLEIAPRRRTWLRAVVSVAGRGLRRLPDRRQIEMPWSV